VHFTEARNSGKSHIEISQKKFTYEDDKLNYAEKPLTKGTAKQL